LQLGAVLQIPASQNWAQGSSPTLTQAPATQVCGWLVLQLGSSFSHTAHRGGSDALQSTHFPASHSTAHSPSASSLFATQCPVSSQICGVLAAASVPQRTAPASQSLSGGAPASPPAPAMSGIGPGPAPASPPLGIAPLPLVPLPLVPLPLVPAPFGAVTSPPSPPAVVGRIFGSWMSSTVSQATPHMVTSAPHNTVRDQRGVRSMSEAPAQRDAR